VASADSTTDWVRGFYGHMCAKGLAALTAVFTGAVRVRLGGWVAASRWWVVKLSPEKLTGFFNATAEQNHEVLYVWHADDKTFAGLT
jgi:hypothetical protein